MLTGECLNPEDNDNDGSQETKHCTPRPDCTLGISTLPVLQSCPRRVGVHGALENEYYSLRGLSDEEGPVSSVWFFVIHVIRVGRDVHVVGIRCEFLGLVCVCWSVSSVSPYPPSSDGRLAVPSSPIYFAGIFVGSTIKFA